METMYSIDLLLNGLIYIFIILGLLYLVWSVVTKKISNYDRNDDEVGIGGMALNDQNRHQRPLEDPSDSSSQ